MKQSKTTKTGLTILAVLFVFAAFTGCTENSIMGPGSSESRMQDNPPPSGISIDPYWEGNVLVFKLRNNTIDTIVNDFHVQFDSTVKITGWVTHVGWVVDQATTDTAKGKIGVKCGPQGQPIPPMGGVGNLVGVQIKFTGVTKKNPRQWWDYTWQATRDGLVVKSGYGTFPRR